MNKLFFLKGCLLLLCFFLVYSQEEQRETFFCTDLQKVALFQLDNLKLEWDWISEKEHRIPELKTWVKQGENYLKQNATWRARWIYQKILKYSRSLRNKANAHLGIASSYYREKSYENVVNHLQIVIERYAGYIPFNTILEWEYSIAATCYHGKRDWLGSSYNSYAIQIYQHIREHAPYHPLGIQSIICEALLHLHEQRYAEGLSVFDLFLYRFPEHPQRFDVYKVYIRTLIQIIRREEGNIHLEKKVRQLIEQAKSVAKSEEQKEHLNRLQEDFKEWESVQLAKWVDFYMKGDMFNESVAKSYYKQLVAQYPNSSAAEKIKERYQSRWSD